MAERPPMTDEEEARYAKKIGDAALKPLNFGVMSLLGLALCVGKAYQLTPPEITWFWATLPFWILPGFLLAIAAGSLLIGGGLLFVVTAMEFCFKRRAAHSMAKKRKAIMADREERANSQGLN